MTSSSPNSNGRTNAANADAPSDILALVWAELVCILGAPTTAALLRRSATGRLGANAFVVKPGSNEERAKLARLIKEFWLELTEPPMMCMEGTGAAEKFHLLPDT